MTHSSDTDRYMDFCTLLGGAMDSYEGSLEGLCDEVIVMCHCEPIQYAIRSLLKDSV